MGKTQIPVTDGGATFTELSFIFKPSSKNISFQLYSSGINEQKNIANFKMFDNEPWKADITSQITFDFRECISGEITYEDSQ